MKTFLLAATAVAGLGLADPALAANISINFDDVTAPMLFSETAPLSNAYSGLGVTFSGVGGVGGSILNQTSNFDRIAALSGVNFLAFNTLVTASEEKISFATPASSVSIYGAVAPSATLTAFDSTNTQLATITQGLLTTSWTQLAVSAANISYVTLSFTEGLFVADNLLVNGAAISVSTSSVPEPASMAILGAGLFGLGAVRRRRA
jgi:hypothetical protein